MEGYLDGSGRFYFACFNGMCGSFFPHAPAQKFFSALPDLHFASQMFSYL